MFIVRLPIVHIVSVTCRYDFSEAVFSGLFRESLFGGIITILEACFPFLPDFYCLALESKARRWTTETTQTLYKVRHAFWENSERFGEWRQRTNIRKYSTRFEECLGAAMPAYKFALGWSVALRATLRTARDADRTETKHNIHAPRGHCLPFAPSLCGKAFRTVLSMCASFRPGTRHRGCHNSDGFTSFSVQIVAPRPHLGCWLQRRVHLLTSYSCIKFASLLPNRYPYSQSPPRRYLSWYPNERSLTIMSSVPGNVLVFRPNLQIIFSSFSHSVPFFASVGDQRRERN